MRSPTGGSCEQSRIAVVYKKNLQSFVASIAEAAIHQQATGSFNVMTYSSITVFIYVCMYIYVCKFICMYVCMYVCMHVWIWV